MKRWLGLLAIVLLLSGCSNPEIQEIEDSETLPTVQSQEQTASVLYDSDNPIEEKTDGAVKAYLPRDGKVIAVAPMGKHLVLFTKNTMTLVRGERMTEIAKVEIPDVPTPNSGMLQIQNDGVAYYDASAKQIVFLSQFFREVGTFSLPADIVGDVYLTPDWRLVYYCSKSGVHVLDLDTGVSRLLKEQSGKWQGINGGFMNGTMLRCTLKQANGEERTMLLSTETGAVLAEGAHLKDLRGTGNCYYLPMEGNSIFGFGEEQPFKFMPAGDGKLYPLPDNHGIVQYTQLKKGCRLDYYDLQTGKRTASVKLEDIAKVSRVFCVDGDILFTCEEDLYRWELKQSPAEDQRIYAVPWYYYDKQDEVGLAAIGRQLEELEERYGVKIFYWNEVEDLAPWDYNFTVEYLTEPYSANIFKLEEVLGQFPDGFFQKVAQWTNSGKLNIILVRGIYAGVETDKYTPASGIQYNADGDTYIALSVGDDFQQWLYHELGHLIDSRVLSTVNSYSQWSSLNPWDFKYDNDYEKNLERTDSKYLEGEKRYFVDFYSMAFAVEDRSRIFEYACMPGNEEVFASAPMQKKLKTICAGIRKAFDLTEEIYIWEQYLK